mmetsp:Transcript_29842/g.70295  ORF Transcript_29842/g.70295 Transcript_29842/m.70295 type:complete len:342 (-) Transcript_29842:688-1713(-)
MVGQIQVCPHLLHRVLDTVSGFHGFHLQAQELVSVECLEPGSELHRIHAPRQESVRSRVERNVLSQVPIPRFGFPRASHESIKGILVETTALLDVPVGNQATVSHPDQFDFDDFPERLALPFHPPGFELGGRSVRGSHHGVVRRGSLDGIPHHDKEFHLSVVWWLLLLLLLLLCGVVLVLVLVQVLARVDGGSGGCGGGVAPLKDPLETGDDPPAVQEVAGGRISRQARGPGAHFFREKEFLAVLQLLGLGSELVVPPPVEAVGFSPPGLEDPRVLVDVVVQTGGPRLLGSQHNVRGRGSRDHVFETVHGPPRLDQFFARFQRNRSEQCWLFLFMFLFMFL